MSNSSIPANIELRPATSDLADELTALNYRAKAAYGYSAKFMALIEEEDHITSAQIERDTIMTAMRDGQILGFAHLMRIDRADTIYLENLYIEPALQGQGIGRLLIEWARDEANRQGFAWLEWDSDPNAASFYRRMGGIQLSEQESGAVPGRMIPKFRMSTVLQAGRIELRSGRPDEATAFTELRARAKAAHGYSDAMMATYRTMTNTTPEEIAQSQVIVAIEGEQMLGFAIIAIEKDEATAKLEDLFVEPEFHGRGVGRVLFEWAVRTARSSGCDWLVWECDPHATGFYEKLGAERTGQAPSTVWDNVMIPRYRIATEHRFKA